MSELTRRLLSLLSAAVVVASLCQSARADEAADGEDGETSEPPPKSAATQSADVLRTIVAIAMVKRESAETAKRDADAALKTRTDEKNGAEKTAKDSCDTRDKLKAAAAARSEANGEGQPPVGSDEELKRAEEQCAAKTEELEQATKALEAAKADALAKASALVAAKEAEAKATEQMIGSPTGFEKLRERLAGARKVRCLTAICWGGPDRTKYGVEPLVDLPVGIVWSAGRGALSSYINSNNLSVEFNAGLRVWVLSDIFSISVYFAKPVARQGDSIRLRGSGFEYASSSIHRPFPSIGFGFFGDILQLGIAYDALVNGSGEQRDKSYPPNQVVSRSVTITLGIATFTAARNVIGMTAGSQMGATASVEAKK